MVPALFSGTWMDAMAVGQRKETIAYFYIVQAKVHTITAYGGVHGNIGGHIHHLNRILGHIVQKCNRTIWTIL